MKRKQTRHISVSVSNAAGRSGENDLIASNSYRELHEDFAAINYTARGYKLGIFWCESSRGCDIAKGVYIFNTTPFAMSQPRGFDAKKNSKFVAAGRITVFVAGKSL